MAESGRSEMGRECPLCRKLIISGGSFYTPWVELESPYRGLCGVKLSDSCFLRIQPIDAAQHVLRKPKKESVRPQDYEILIKLEFLPLKSEIRSQSNIWTIVKEVHGN